MYYIYVCLVCGVGVWFLKSLLAVNPAAPDSPAEPAPTLPRNLPRARARNSREIPRGPRTDTPGESPAGPGPNLLRNLARPGSGFKVCPQESYGKHCTYIKCRPYTHLYSNHSHARSAREIFWRPLCPRPLLFHYTRAAREFF